MSLSEADRFAEFVDAPQVPDGDDTRPAGAGAAGYASDQPTAAETLGLLALVSALRQLDFDVSPGQLTRERHRKRLVATAAVRTIEVPRRSNRGVTEDRPPHQTASG